MKKQKFGWHSSSETESTEYIQPKLIFDFQQSIKDALQRDIKRAGARQSEPGLGLARDQAK